MDEPLEFLTAEDLPEGYPHCDVCGDESIVFDDDDVAVPCPNCFTLGGSE